MSHSDIITVISFTRSINGTNKKEIKRLFPIKSFVSLFLYTSRELLWLNQHQLLKIELEGCDLLILWLEIISVSEIDSRHD